MFNIARYITAYLEKTPPTKQTLIIVEVKKESAMERKKFGYTKLDFGRRKYEHFSGVTFCNKLAEKYFKYCEHKDPLPHGPFYFTL